MPWKALGRERGINHTVSHLKACGTSWEMTPYRACPLICSGLIVLSIIIMMIDGWMDGA